MIARGLVIIGGHRSWREPVAITISPLGWFITVWGLLLVTTPSTLESAVDAALLSPTAMTLSRVALLGVAGLLLTYVGWFTRPADPEPVARRATACRGLPSQGSAVG